jgi:Family of unknown function (DUF6572)
MLSWLKDEDGTLDTRERTRPAVNQQDQPSSESRHGRAGMIDAIAHDSKTDEAVLVMNEPRPWNDSDEQLYELQERFNAYVSFLLDGEFAEWNPQLAKKPVRIEVRCAQMPEGRALDLLTKIHDQLAHQEINVEVLVREQGSGNGPPVAP